MDIFLNILFLIMGSVITFWVLWYQERHPELIVKCELTDNLDPGSLNCILTNNGRAEARDVYVGFNRILPVGTTLISNPELGAAIIPSNNPPDPDLFQISAEYSQAFAVRLPRVPAKETVTFQVTSADEDNKRAAKQIERIWAEIRLRLHLFGEKLMADHPEYYDKFNLDDFMFALMKRENIFSPGRFTYESGTSDIEFLTQQDKFADATVDDLTRTYKSQYGYIFEESKEFKAPVFKISILGGTRTFAIGPPFVKTKVEFRVPRAEFSKGKPIKAQPSIPSTYDDQGSA